MLGRAVGQLVVGAARATVRVRLTASGGASQVTVYGTATGVRSDPQLGMRLDAEQIEQVPVLGRKITSLPLLNAAFRSGKGTGDLFLNTFYFVSGAGGRREASYAVDGATGDEPWGRQTMFSTLPIGAVHEMTVLSSAFSAEFGWTSSTAVNVVTKAGTNVVHGEALYLGRPARWEKSSATTGSESVARPMCRTCSIRCRARSGARSSKIARFCSPPATTRGRTARRTSRARCPRRS